MSRTDLIADAFTIIRNAIMAKKDTVDIPASGILGAILEILKKENYIENFKLIEDSKQGRIKVYLKYIHDKPAIKNLKRISKSSTRIYVKADKVPLVLRGRGMAIITTSKGILTDREARELNTGGEVIAYVW
ncbi:MAG: 30S ribosomal protein S8 [Candidatus Omnitrophota bacterium]|nr:30S ribosomal protein S8 [Candidatus Omnitrophota bacterium]